MSESATATETLTEFQRNAADWLDRLKATGEPVALTHQGKEELVVQDAVAYRRMAELAERAEMMEFLNNSLADVEAGRTRPAREFLESLSSGQ